MMATTKYPILPLPLRHTDRPAVHPPRESRYLNLLRRGRRRRDSRRVATHGPRAHAAGWLAHTRPSPRLARDLALDQHQHLLIGRSRRVVFSGSCCRGRAAVPVQHP